MGGNAKGTGKGGNNRSVKKKRQGGGGRKVLERIKGKKNQ